MYLFKKTALILCLGIALPARAQLQNALTALTDSFNTLKKALENKRPVVPPVVNRPSTGPKISGAPITKPVAPQKNQQTGKYAGADLIQVYAKLPEKKNNNDLILHVLASAIAPFMFDRLTQQEKNSFIRNSDYEYMTFLFQYKPNGGYNDQEIENAIKKMVNINKDAGLYTDIRPLITSDSNIVKIYAIPKSRGTSRLITESQKKTILAKLNTLCPTNKQGICIPTPVESDLVAKITLEQQKVKDLFDDQKIKDAGTFIALDSNPTQFIIKTIKGNTITKEIWTLK